MIRSLLCVIIVMVTVSTLAQEVRTEIARQPLPPQLRQRTPANEPDRVATPIEAPSSLEAASEFGEQLVLIRHAEWNPWRCDASVSGYFTDNVALAPNRVQDYFMKYDVSAGYSNRISGSWSMDVALSQSFVRYDKFNTLDFDLSRADAGVAYQADWLDDTTFFLRYSFYSLANAGFGKQILRNHTLSVGAQKIWKLSQGQQLFFGMSADPSLEAVPTVAQRDEYSTFGGWSLRLTEKLTAQLTGRVGYHVSSASDRTDWNYVALAGATYALTDWANIGITSSIAWNESSKAIFTYRNSITGVFVGVNVTF